jgi:hypothetical protein
MIITGGFLQEAQAQRAALGMESLEPVVITHPLSTLSDADIEHRAQEAVPQIRKILLK